MKKIVFVFALVSFSLLSTTTQVKAQSSIQKEQTVTFSVSASQPNAKQPVAKILSSVFGLNFGVTMKQLSQGGTVTLTLKKGATKEEAAAIKSALEGAGAEIEVK